MEQGLGLSEQQIAYLNSRSGKVPKSPTPKIGKNPGKEAASAVAQPKEPDQVRNQRYSRNQDIERGLDRGRDIFFNDPAMKWLSDKRKSMADGLDSEQYQGLRDDMIRGQQQANSGYLRQLLSAQGRGGVGGARSAGQQAALFNEFDQNRSDAERKLLIDNIALERQGLGDYQDLFLRQKFGELSQGMGEAQLGVADRTGYQQQIIGEQMAEAAAKQPKPGFLGQIFGGLF